MTSHRVLHVDDDPDIRMIVELSLGLDPDFSLQSCASGREALTAASACRPDLILLDVMMPTMDGPATLANLLECAATADIPVVFMTGHSHGFAHYRSLGAAGVIVKPFDPMTLAASVKGYLPNRLD